MYCRSHTTCTLSALHYLNLDLVVFLLYSHAASAVTFFIRESGVLLIFMEDATDVTAGGRSVGQVECKR